MTIFEQNFSLQKLSQRFQITLKYTLNHLKTVLNELIKNNFLGKRTIFRQKKQGYRLRKMTIFQTFSKHFSIQKRSKR